MLENTPLRGSLLLATLIVVPTIHVDARGFRVALIPNGSVNRCGNCHVTPGGPRTPFGLAVEELVTPGGREEFWGPELAALDSDGDGRSNGDELLDAAGGWTSGDPDPGNPDQVTNPGVPESQVPTLSTVGWALLGLLMLTAGSVVMIRRRNPAFA